MLHQAPRTGASGPPADPCSAHRPSEGRREKEEDREKRERWQR
jgi:hypothetical protein